MINLFKKGFIYLALIMLTLVSFNVEDAQAAEAVDYEEGVSNFNNTPENSATIGNKLLKPEIGWKRYDDSNSVITKNKMFHQSQPNKAYKNGQSQGNSVGTHFKFEFIGTKFRIIDQLNTNRDKNTKVTIDGEIVEYYSSYRPDSWEWQTLVYEKKGLTNTKHTVLIEKSDDSSYLAFDAIDVDGKLFVPGEVPDVQSITLDRNTLELLEGSQDKLTATTSPETANVIWSSSDESIATVDQNGNVTAIREGEAVITAKIENTDLVATATVIVKKPINESSSAILSITLVNGITKEYDVTNTILNSYLNWFESAQGTSTFKFTKTISPYKKVTEYIVHDKIASFEVREY
ncbi:Ig-like domain-containing protein [Lysinibacillus sp. NPDC096418]|uniref:Ig-like domain-containing protein n=1 Tax=Lysinibacillus sp. NPDC096418 TaxID=3364138 RepID=UPI0037F2795D